VSERKVCFIIMGIWIGILALCIASLLAGCDGSPSDGPEPITTSEMAYWDGDRVVITFNYLPDGGLIQKPGTDYASAYIWEGTVIYDYVCEGVQTYRLYTADYGSYTDFQVVIPEVALAGCVTLPPPPPKRVKVCHYGVTIEVLEADLDKHLSHGDPLGDCPPTVEDCFTIGDEDHNGFADCDDPACQTYSICRKSCDAHGWVIINPGDEK
jgi:hypothetical protein